MHADGNFPSCYKISEATTHIILCVKKLQTHFFSTTKMKWFCSPTFTGTTEIMAFDDGMAVKLISLVNLVNVQNLAEYLAPPCGAE